MRVRSLVLIPALTAAALGIGTSHAPPAAADCVSSSGTTICSQGTVRGSDTGNGPSGAEPYYPYPCEYDWYCDDGVNIILGDGDIGFPGRPGNRPGIGR